MQKPAEQIEQLPDTKEGESDVDKEAQRKVYNLDIN